jgi:uncharacterized protein YchJ
MINDGWMIVDDVYQYYYESDSNYNNNNNNNNKNSSLDNNRVAKNSLEIFKDTPDNFYRNSNQGKYIKNDNEYKKSTTAKKILNKKEIGRNDPCLCGSGKKYKKCCLKIV